MMKVVMGIAIAVIFGSFVVQNLNYTLDGIVTRLQGLL